MPDLLGFPGHELKECIQEGTALLQDARSAVQELRVTLTRANALLDRIEAAATGAATGWQASAPKGQP